MKTPFSDLSIVLFCRGQNTYLGRENLTRSVADDNRHFRAPPVWLGSLQLLSIPNGEERAWKSFIANKNILRWLTACEISSQRKCAVDLMLSLVLHARLWLMAASSVYGFFVTTAVRFSPAFSSEIPEHRYRSRQTGVGCQKWSAVTVTWPFIERKIDSPNIWIWRRILHHHFWLALTVKEHIIRLRCDKNEQREGDVEKNNKNLHNTKLLWMDT